MNRIVGVLVLAWVWTLGANPGAARAAPFTSFRPIAEMRAADTVCVFRYVVSPPADDSVSVVHDDGLSWRDRGLRLIESHADALAG